MRVTPQPTDPRPARASDLNAVLALFDETIEWFVSIGNTQQWGSEPFSSVPRHVERVRTTLALPGAWVAESAEGQVLAVLVLAAPEDDIPAATEPETFVRLLLSSRAPQARGWGRRLMAFAEQRARAAGHRLLRLDCFGGGDEALVRFYESCGLVRAERFMDGDWPVQIMTKRLDAVS